MMMKQQAMFKNMSNEPLANRLRPITLTEYVGQRHLIGPGKILYQLINSDVVPSMVFWGPPGVGKTTLARIIANQTKAKFINFSAVTSGIKDIRAVMKQAQEVQDLGEKTIVFVDEIHRFNKGQQDYLLPFVEDGTLILIGATTENPYFEVNGALISRSIVFELKPLSTENIKQLILRAVNDKEKGMRAFNARIDDDAADFLAEISNGDARTALNAIELGILTTDKSEDGTIHITMEVAEQCIQKRAIRYDKSGDNHYDTVSAFIKSMRGSDPDAALYYLAKMLYAGESVEFIARRIMISAAEDVGMADPNALTVAVSAANAVHQIGMPEAKIILAEAVVYMATAPKSNASYMGLEKAMSAVQNTKISGIPIHLMDAHYKGAAKLGHGDGYKYAHDYENHYVNQQYLPDELVNEVFYNPGDLGYEVKVKEHFKKIKG